GGGKSCSAMAASSAWPLFGRYLARRHLGEPNGTGRTFSGGHPAESRMAAMGVFRWFSRRRTILFKSPTATGLPLRLGCARGSCRRRSRPPPAKAEMADFADAQDLISGY